MATKRYTDATKWSDPWFQELPKDYKFLWMYLLDKCDHAGIYRFSRKQLEFDLEISLDIEEMKNVFDGRVIILDWEKWFIYKFVKFQYGQLNPQNSCHKSVIKILKEYGLYDRVVDLLGSCEVVDTTLLPPMKGVRTECVASKDKDQYQDKDKDQDKDTDKDQLTSTEPNDQLTSEWQLYAKACACFGSSPDNFITDGRKRYLRLIRGDVRVGADLFIRACENRARAPDVPGKISPDYFFCDQWQERITEWAKGPPKYGSFKDSEKPNKKRNADIAMEWLRDQQGQS